jgi:sporulation protein YtfJ
MLTAMNSIEDMIDVNTIIGEPIETNNGIVIIPISKVSFGFAAGGSEFNTNKIGKFSENTKLPFGGGSGAGVHISPVGFLVMKDGNARVLNVNGINVIDRAVDMIPDLINKIDGILNKKMDKEAKEKETIQPEVSPDDME